MHPDWEAHPPEHEHEEERPHMLFVDLEELELRPEAAHETPGFFQSLTYAVSFHPSSEHPEAIPLPPHPPRATVEGQYLVSKSHAAKEVEGPSRFSFQQPAEQTARQHPHIPFKERLELTLSRMDQHLVAYLWGRKTSVRSEEFTLVGRAVIPMDDYTSQRKLTKWGVFDIAEHHRVAELHIRYAVCTTPSAVQKPRVAEAEQTKVTVTWEPPGSDHGSPLTGYKISILLNQTHETGPQWHTVCELTKTLNTAYVVTNLTGNTAYLLDVRAVNKVGAGDPTEFQITTAPCEPDPPSQPWVDERRDNCFNVAWYPCAHDGGFPVTHYRIKMRKVVGAARKVTCGVPGESKSVWIDMGTVAANDKEKESPSVYSAWVGPLEKEHCEYRFQVFAVSKAGESEGSEISGPEYA
uniref:Fibronectin type-III domain-containing protein n=1 Tax=Zooxanthella nutricula TaxID=1333877 RepID=A0A7S2IVG3_9DINO